MEKAGNPRLFHFSSFIGSGLGDLGSAFLF